MARVAEAPDPSATVRALAVLLEAGVEPARAWTHMARAGDAVAADVAEAIAVPGEGVIARAVAAHGDQWRELALAWRTAEVVGAPLAPSLRAVASAQRDAREVRDDLRVAMAEPAATARVVGWLPLVALVMGFALGFDLSAALRHPLGIAFVAVGIALMLVARGWTKRLVARAQPPAEIPGMSSELVAIALSGGGSVERARDVLRAIDAPPPDSDTERVLALSIAAGAPAVELLRAQAQSARHDARTRGRADAAALSSKLLLPLGVCTLPAFIALGVGPMMLAVLTSTPMIP